MAHWCFQLLCILKTRMSWKSLCLLFFISTKTGFNSTGNILWGTGDVCPPVVCHWNHQCCSLLWRITAPLQYYSLNTVMQNLSCSLPPILSRSPETVITIFPLWDFFFFWSHLTLRTWSVFLILTKINLLFSCWILCAYECCDSHIQELSYSRRIFQHKCLKCYFWISH